MTERTLVPKYVQETLTPKNNTIAVRNGLVFDYYPLKVEYSGRGLFANIISAPHLVSEGWVTFNKKVYFVSIQDYLRRRVNVTTAANLASINSTDTGAAGTSSSGVNSESNGNVQQHTDQQGPSQQTADEHKEADLAWKEQIRELYSATAEEEGWDISDIIQSE